MLERPQHPQTPKLCGKRSISITVLTMKKRYFFTKIIFSQYFWDFSTPQSKDFRDFGDPAMCPSLSMGLGALEARWERAFNEPKIIQIGLQIFAGDDFEKIFFS